MIHILVSFFFFSLACAKFSLWFELLQREESSCTYSTSVILQDLSTIMIYWRISQSMTGILTCFYSRCVFIVVLVSFDRNCEESVFMKCVINAVFFLFGAKSFSSGGFLDRNICGVEV